MDEGAGQIRDEIREDVSDIFRTRVAMSEKLELLEARLQEAVQETKDAMLDVVDNVRDTAQDLVDHTKRTINPVYQVQQHPWIMLGAAIAGGFLLARAGAQASGNGHEGYGNPSMASGELAGTPAEARERGTTYQASAQISAWQRSLMDDLMDQAQDEVQHIKQALIVAARTFLRDMAKEALRLVADPLERTVTGRSGSRPHVEVRQPRY